MKIGFIGLGTMGAPMCTNILKKHDDTVYVFNRTAEKMEPLVKMGAEGCKTIPELAEKSDLIFTMVTNSTDSEEVYDTMIPVLKKGKVCVDMSTIDPGVSVAISDRVKQTGAEFLDCPVVRSQPDAVKGTLGIYVGGNKRTAQKILPYLLYMGDKVMYIGFNGAGLIMKVCHNALMSQIQNGVNETMALAQASGIDPQKFAMAMSYGNAQNRYLDTKWRTVENEKYTPAAFSVNNMNKDVGIALRYAKSLGRTMPGEEVVQEVYNKAEEKDLGQEDIAATYKVVL